MLRRRILTALATCAMILIGAMGVVGAGVSNAWAAGGLTVVSLVDNPHSKNNSDFIRVDQDTGGVAYCAQGWLREPTVGQTLEYYGSLGIPELDYVMWHGYDGSVVTSLYGLDPERSEAATSYAVWLAIAEQRGDILTYRGPYGSVYHGNKGYKQRFDQVTDDKIRDAVNRLYSEALAYKESGGNGVEKGCATLWRNSNSVPIGDKKDLCYQALVTAKKTIPVRFTKTSADASYTQGNASYSLAGAVFDIFEADTDKKVETITTDADGRASMHLDANASYYAIEKDAPKGYLPIKGKIPFKTGPSGGEVAVEDKPGSFNLVVAKKDAATSGAPQAGASLEGAQYKATSLSSPGWSATGTTDRSGTTSFKDVPLGRVQVVETKAPEGYVLDPTIHEFTVEDDGTEQGMGTTLVPENDFAEIPVAFDVEIAKFKTDGVGASKLEVPAEGVSFEIVAGSSGKVIGSITTGKDGFATTKGTWFGSGSRVEGIAGAIPYDRKGYTIREVESTVPQGYQRVDDWSISKDQMENGAQLHYIVNNTQLTSRLQIVKKDQSTQEVVKLPGFSFQILRDGKPIAMDIWNPEHKVVDTFTTDENGSVTLPEPLPVGTYLLHEVNAAVPYLKNPKDLAFSIDEKDGAVAPVTVISMSDKIATGSASIKKTCAQNGKPLAGAEFDVVALERIEGVAGRPTIEKNSVVAHVITDQKGLAAVDNLSIGAGSARYAFIETKPPQGHVLDRTPHAFTLSYKNDSTDVVTARSEAGNQPNEIEIRKTVQGEKKPLSGAEFYIWNTLDEISCKPTEGLSSAVVSIEGGARSVAAQPIFDHAQLVYSAPEHVEVQVIDSKGHVIDIEKGGHIDPGDYIFSCRDAQKGRDDEKSIPITLEAGSSYTVTIGRNLFGLSCSIDKPKPLGASVEFSLDKENRVFTSKDVPAGEHRLLIDGKEVGRIKTVQGHIGYWKYSSKKLHRIPTLLRGGVQPMIEVTNEHGLIVRSHLAPGTYKCAESKAPSGFVTNESVHEFTVDTNGLVDGRNSHLVDFDNDFIKVSISKRDITNEEELPGAQLELKNAKGDVIDSWISESTPHVMDKLAPGAYQLIEKIAPRTYDRAQSIDFTVEETSEVQHVVMYDQPIKITGSVDKRQEIAKPTAADTTENGDGKNNAKPNASNDGSFVYTIDARNTSNTWVDEFTVEDEIAGAKAGLTKLEALITPQASGDFDGKVNVWFKTNIDREVGAQDANATLDDGHENPWLKDDSTAEALGKDARALSYEGWSLWKQDLPTTESSTLLVSDLDLAKSEVITNIRLEYGRVEEGFSSRQGGWDSKRLKDPHDDFDELKPSHDESFAQTPSEETSFAPLTLKMTVTDSYRDAASLINNARVDLYRNGGGTDLEDHDGDQVIQTPKTVYPELSQTGSVSAWALAVGSSLCAVVGAGIWMRRR